MIFETYNYDGYFKNFSSPFSENITFLPLDMRSQQNIYLMDDYYLFCYFQSNYINIDCLKILINQGFSKETSPITVLECDANPKMKYFYLYSLKDTISIIGCGVNRLKLQVITQDMEILENPIIIDDGFEEYRFTVMSDLTIYIAGSIKQGNEYYHYGEIFTLGLDNNKNYQDQKYEYVFGFRYNTTIKQFEKCPPGCFYCQYGVECYLCDHENKFYWLNKNNKYYCYNKTNVPVIAQINLTTQYFEECLKNWYKDENDDIHCINSCNTIYSFQLKSKECLQMTNSSELQLDIPKSDISSFIDDNVVSFISSGQNIKGDDFNLQIYPTSNPLLERNDISSIDLSPCESILRN